MTATEVAAPNNQALHSPLLKFLKHANCQQCPLHNACLSDKTLETRCILALIADSLRANTQQNTTPRDAHL